MVYKTLILPHYDYCDAVYDSLSKQYADKLQRLQNMCIENILGVSRWTSTIDVHRRVKLPLLEGWTLEKECYTHV